MPEDKYVDESWKETASLEKEQLEKTSRGSAQEPKSEKNGLPKAEEDAPAFAREAGAPEEAKNSEMNFFNYLTSLAFQTMIFLGEIPNPVTNQADKNFDQAKMLIDTLLMLREKTQGNLSKKESDFLNGSLYELQMKYVELTRSQ